MTQTLSGIPKLAAKTSRSRQARCSVSKIRRNCRNLTSIVANVATTASFTTSVKSRSCSAERNVASRGTPCSIYDPPLPLSNQKRREAVIIK